MNVFAASIALLCGYSMGHFCKGVGSQEVVEQHTHVIEH